jgi:hypothetical protein
MGFLQGLIEFSQEIPNIIFILFFLVFSGCHWFLTSLCLVSIQQSAQTREGTPLLEQQSALNLAGNILYCDFRAEPSIWFCNIIFQ